MTTHILPHQSQMRRDDKCGPHRQRIVGMRAQGFSFKEIADKIGVSHVSVWKRWHQWQGNLPTGKERSEGLRCPHCGGKINP